MSLTIHHHRRSLIHSLLILLLCLLLSHCLSLVRYLVCACYYYCCFSLPKFHSSLLEFSCNSGVLKLTKTSERVKKFTFTLIVARKAKCFGENSCDFTSQTRALIAGAAAEHKSRRRQACKLKLALSLFSIPRRAVVVVVVVVTKFYSFRPPQHTLCPFHERTPPFRASEASSACFASICAHNFSRKHKRLGERSEQ